MPEALTLTNGQNLTVLTSHDMSGILNSKVNIWVTDSQLLKYQSLLLEGPVTKLKVCGNLNPATFLPEKENETSDHDCSQFLILNYAARKALTILTIPSDNPDVAIFTDGSLFVQIGKCKTDYAVVLAEQVLEAKSLYLTPPSPPQPGNECSDSRTCGSDLSSKSYAKGSK